MKSVWEIDDVLHALDREGLKTGRQINSLLNYLVRYPEIESWDQVDWTHRSLRVVPESAVRILKSEFIVRCSKKEAQFDSADGSTSKLIISSNEKRYEAVVIRHKTLKSRRVTVCVSSQVGCAMKCSFCATGTMGFLGDLSQAEIIEQFLYAKGIEARCSNLVFMGMGEPLNNYNNVLKASRVLLDNTLFSLGRVTLSTVGISKMIIRLANDEPRINLALSLHAPTQEKRQFIMPAAQADPFPKLISALDYYVEKKVASQVNAGEVTPSKKKLKTHLLMIEYILLAGVNDTLEDADHLGALLKHSVFGQRAMVNLIAYNPTPGLPYERPSEAAVRDFQGRVQSYGVLTCVRITMGADVNGACGQLLLKEQKTKSNEKEAKDVVADIEDFASPAKLNHDKKKGSRIANVTHHHRSKSVISSASTFIVPSILSVFLVFLFFFLGYYYIMIPSRPPSSHHRILSFFFFL